MGRGAPWSRINLPAVITQLREHVIPRQALAARPSRKRDQENIMPTRFDFKEFLSRIWHAPDRFRLMDPLPLMHRRGIIIAFLIIIIAILWPDNDKPAGPIVRDAQLDLQSQSPMQAHIVTTQDLSQNENVALPEASPPAPVSQPDSDDPEQHWSSYEVAAGQTMAQLFRNNNLPPSDVYAMARVEGSDKPLSNLQTGQSVQIRQNENGVVTALTIDVGNNQQVLFTRQPDGTFIRVR